MISKPLAVFMSHSAQPSGAELLMLRVASSMEDHRVLVVLGQEGPLVDLLESRGLEVVTLPLFPSAGAGAHVKTVVSFVTRLRSLLRKEKASVLYTHSAPSHLLGGVAARMGGVRHVAHAHDILSPQTQSGMRRALLRAGFWLFPHAVIANSVATMNSLGPARPGQPRGVIGCPVEGSAFETGPPQDTEEVRFGVLGRIARWKGQEVAVRSFAKVRSLSNIPMSLHLAGGALFAEDSVYERELTELISQLGLEEHIIRRGHVQDPGAFLAECSVVLHTSIRPEPFGQVIIEAMAAGRPVIASAAGGPSEIITNWQDGLLYEAGDVAALASHMYELARTPSARRIFGTEARKTAERYAVEQIVPRIEHVLVKPPGFLSSTS